MMDASNYNEGKRGGKSKSKSQLLKKLIKNTGDKKCALWCYHFNIDGFNCKRANDQGKIKLKKVTDATAKDVEIQIELASGISPDITIDACMHLQIAK
jgi:topoisomerase-4 subunit A